MIVYRTSIAIVDRGSQAGRWRPLSRFLLRGCLFDLKISVHRDIKILPIGILLLLLNGIVTQVSDRVIILVDVKIRATYLEVGILKDVNFKWLNGGDEHPLADVKLTLVCLVARIEISQ